MKEDSLIEQKELRDRCVDQIEVLAKIKDLVLIPQLDCMSMRQIADFYEVEYEAIRQCYHRNEDEIKADGFKTVTPKSFKELTDSLDVTSCHFQKIESARGYSVYDLGNGTVLSIPNAGIKLFSKRAIMRFGMLLRDSRVAQELRTQLLNIVENVESESPELLVKEIDNETDLLLEVGKAYISGDLDKFAAATQSVIAYKNRHIEKLQREADSLQHDKEVLTSSNLTISDRKAASRIVRCAASKLRMNYQMLWSIVYKQLKYKYGIDVKARAARNPRGNKSYISYLKDSEYPSLQKTVSAILSANGISPAEFYKKNLDDVYMRSSME